MKRLMKKIGEQFKRLLTFKKKKEEKGKNAVRIPVAGVQPEEVIRSPDEGVILIESTQSYIVEEYERYKPWRAYSSFGFNRSIRLPEGVKIERIQTNFDDDGIELKWD